MGCEAFEYGGEVLAGEVPAERLGNLVPVVFEGVDGASEFGGVVEVVGLEQFALHD